MSSELTLVVIAGGVGLVLLAGLMLAAARAYRAVSPAQALVISKPGAAQRVTFTGAVVMPILHRAEVMDLSVQTIEVVRRGKDGVVCRDHVRADVAVKFYLRVNRTAEDVRRVAEQLGCARASDPATLRDLFGAKLAEAIKVLAARFDLEELVLQRAAFRDALIELAQTDLGGYVLDDVVIDHLEQTPVDQLDPNNLLDAQGIRKIRDRAASNADVAAAARARAAASAPPTLASRLDTLGLRDARVTTEISCDISSARAPLALSITDPDDPELPGRLPSSVPRSVLAAAGRGHLACADGRATFRWDTHPTDDQLVAAARLVYAFRETPR